MTSFVQAGDGHGALVGGGLSFTGNVAIGNSVVVWICDYNTSGSVISTSTPTYNGSPVTGAVKLLEVQSTASGTSNIMYVAVYLLPNVQSSGKPVGISAPVNGNNDVNSHYYIAEFAGLGATPAKDAASPDPATAFGDSGGTVSSGATGAAVGASGIALGAMMQDGASSGWTAPGGWTALTESFGGAAYQVFSASGSAYTWNPTGTGASQWAAGAVILDASAPAPAAPAAPLPPLIRPHPYGLILGEAQQRIDWASPGVADLTVTFSSASGGVDTYNVLSPYNSGQTQQMRVLNPTSPNPSYPHAFLLMLPVDSGQSTTFGDSIGVAQSLAAHNGYNLTIVQPGYTGQGGTLQGPWYADNPLNTAISYEKYTLLVHDWIRKNLATTGTERTYLIGFSRSGLGGQGLLFRHPYLFAAAATWDSPFMMTDYDGTDPTAGTTIGGQPDLFYGTSSNFTTKYQLSAAHLANWQATGQYAVNRIWIGLGPAFGADVPAYDALLTSTGIPHSYNFANTVESHAWQTDWVAAGLAAIVPSNYATAPLLPQRIPHPLFTQLLEVAAYRTDGVPAPAATITGTAAAAGAASVTAVVTQVTQGSPAGAAAVADAVTQIVTAAAAGAGSVTAAASGGGTSTASSAGAGSVTAVVTQIATAAAAGAGVITAAGQITGAASIAGAAAATAKAVQAATASPAGAAVLTALAAQQATAVITGAGSVTAAGGLHAAFTVGTLTASDAAGGAGGVLTASDQRTGGPG